MDKTIGYRTLKDDEVDAEPTKELFIYMITRDVSLDKAILDLIDNSVDAAKSLKGPDGPFDGCKISIEISKDHFSIKDNCGGFDSKTAKEYVFKLGRSVKEKMDICETGNFGIGLKRTLFKLSNQFYVRSRCKGEEFSIQAKIDEWKKQSDWIFKINMTPDDKNKLSEDGVYILADDIFEENKHLITDDFIKTLREDIQQSLSRVLAKKLRVLINGIELEGLNINFTEETYFNPISFTKTQTINGSDVTFELYAGLADRDKWNSGWYIFCNDRLIISADQTLLTGWGDKLPKFHTNFALFRGYAFLRSCDGNVLPWTTNKSGINTSSISYIILKQYIAEISKPICNLLSMLATERTEYNKNPEAFPKPEPYLSIIERAPLKKIEDTKFTTRIELPPVEIITSLGTDSNPYTSVQYLVLKERIELVKNCLAASSNREVGLKTFNYYYEMECNDE